MNIRRLGETLLVRLDPGEPIIETLSTLCLCEGIRAGSFSGIGSCRSPELGFFDSAAKVYRYRIFEGEFEIASLTGNVTVLHGRPFVHAHIVLSGPDFEARAGHLRGAVTATACEIALTPLPGEASRVFDPEAGFNRLD